MVVMQEIGDAVAVCLYHFDIMTFIPITTGEDVLFPANIEFPFTVHPMHTFMVPGTWLFYVNDPT